MSLDPNCLALARHFLADVAGHQEADVIDLAEGIQLLAENFCADFRAAAIDELQGVGLIEVEA